MSSSSLTVGVLALQGAFIEHVRILRSLAQEQAARGGLAVTVVEVRKPSQVSGLSGLVIPGGESTTLSVFLRENDFESTLKAWMFSEKPGVVWGTCAGMILLSNELDGQKRGGQITVRAGATPPVYTCS